jgi:PPM family protein phosphatase
MRPKTQDSDQGFALQFFVPASPPPNVEFGAASHQGLVRKTNEDHFGVFRRTRAHEILLSNLASDRAPLDGDETAIFGHVLTSYTLVVADGMGGAAAGETASRVAIQEAFELADRASSWVMRLRSVAAQQIEQRIQAYAGEIDRTLRAMGEADPDLEGMGTTWTSASVVGWHVLVVQIGDSRAYLWREGKLRQVTHDQTLAQVLIDSGVPPAETRHARNILTNSLGGRSELVHPEIVHLRLEDGDRLLLCTDGLTRELADADIAEVLARPTLPQVACDELIKLAVDHGGRDNITVVVAAISGSDANDEGRK